MAPSAYVDSAITDPILDQLVGDFEGTYFTGGNEVGLSLKVYKTSDRYEAIYQFYAPANNPTDVGLYKMNVSYNTAKNQYELLYNGWLNVPTGSWWPINLYGELNSAGTVFSETEGNTNFSLNRISVDYSDIVGAYTGTYYASQGLMNLDLNVGINGYGEHMASFNYYPHPQNSNPVAQATGSYDMQVMYSQTYDEYTFVGVSWTNQSPNYVFIHLRGSRNSNTFSGISMGTYDRWTFNLTRISNEIMQIEMLDTDEDGIPDYIEQLINSGFLRMGNGVSLMDYEGAVPLSWNNINIQDSDGDGIPDGEEIYIRYPDDPDDGTYAWIQINSNPCLADTDGDGYPDGSDERVMLWDVRVVEMDDDHVLFNSGNEWERIDCTAREFYSRQNNVFSSVPRCLNNIQQNFTAEEIVFLAPYNLEGLKLYFDYHDNRELRELSYKLLMGHDTKYMKKTSSNVLDPWEEVPDYGNELYNFFSGKVISEADIMFAFARVKLKLDLDDIVRSRLRPFANVTDSFKYVFSGRVDDGNSYFFGFMYGLSCSGSFGNTPWMLSYLQEEIDDKLQNDSDFLAGYLMGSGTGQLAMIAALTFATQPATTGNGLVKDGLGDVSGNTYTVTREGLDTVKQHLSEFPGHAPNTAMINRLETALGQGAKITGADASFYLHELKEFELMQAGMNYDLAHQASLNFYNVSPFSLYHPNVIQTFPSEFNALWKEFWGLPF